MGDEVDLEVVCVKREVIEVEYPLDQLLNESKESPTDDNGSSGPPPRCITSLNEVMQAENQQNIHVKQEPMSEEGVVELPVIVDVRSTEGSFIKEEPKEEVASQHQSSNRKRRASSRQPEPSSLSPALSCIKTRGVEEPSTSIVTSSSTRNNELDAIQQLLSTLQKPIDEDQVFGEHVACQMRSIHDPSVKHRCKRMIMEALLNAMREESNE